MRTSLFQKISVSFLLVAFLAPTILFYPKESSAQIAGAFAGGAASCATALIADIGLDKLSNSVSNALDKFKNNIGLSVPGAGSQEIPVHSEKEEAATKKFSLKTCIDNITNNLLKVALAKLKKHLLDRLTDDVIAWIQDEKDPKFISNFGQWIKEPVDAAIGDTIIALGMGQLCSSIPVPRLQLTLQNKTFTEQTRCTLSQVVGNFDAFMNNFSQGGWIGYQEMLMPQNNFYGMTLLTSIEASKRADAAKKEAEAKYQTGGGYKTIQMCTSWMRMINVPLGTDLPYEILDKNGSNVFGLPWNDSYLDPLNIPPSNDGNSLQGSLGNWKCIRLEDTLPGATVAASANEALSPKTDTQAISNADDLSPYLTAIFDAAVNRLIKEGVKGLKAGFESLQSDSYANRLPTPYGTSTRDSLYRDTYATDTKATVAGNIGELKAIIASKVASSTLLITSLRIQLQEVITLNTNLMATTTALMSCQQTNGFLQKICDTTSQSFNLFENRGMELTNYNISLTDIETHLNTMVTALLGNPTNSWLQSNILTADSIYTGLLNLKAQLTTVRVQIIAESSIMATERSNCLTYVAGMYTCPTY